jgi:hypothetical protein
VLTAEELSNISLRQIPALLDFAARTGETVRVEINETEQGAVVQEGVNVVLDCGPWLAKFPGGSVNWYKFTYRDWNHRILGFRTAQTFHEVFSATITGEFDEIYTIIRTTISADAEDPSRGVYECEVCTSVDECNSANTTVASVGRQAIIDRGTSTIPVMVYKRLDVYNIGSTICLTIHPLDAMQNVPLALATLQCEDVGRLDSLNIPSLLPSPLVTWTHTSVDGISAPFAVNRDPHSLSNPLYEPPPEFGSTFPALVGPDSPLTVAIYGNALDIDVNNITRDYLVPRYQALTEVFGYWTCTLSNSLGTQTVSTFISDSCSRPHFHHNCATLLSNETFVIGCVVCVEPST